VKQNDNSMLILVIGLLLIGIVVNTIQQREYSIHGKKRIDAPQFFKDVR
jgi:hypothetical protein